MVLIIMNLAFIPDEVLMDKDFNFEAGWHKKFAQLMQRYKRNWSAKTGKEWLYQCEEIEESYNQFMIERFK